MNGRLSSFVDLLRHTGLPGYAQLPWRTRCYLNLRSLRNFVCSWQGLRYGYCLLIWFLAGRILAWQLDLYGSAAAYPALAAAVWALPWAAAARRRGVAELLAGRWPH